MNKVIKGEELRENWYALYLSIIRKDYSPDDAIRAMKLEKESLKKGDKKK